MASTAKRQEGHGRDLDSSEPAPIPYTDVTVFPRRLPFSCDRAMIVHINMERQVGQIKL